MMKGGSPGDDRRGKVVSLCLSERKGVVKSPVDTVQLVRDHGIQGDAHAGSWHRQVSLLDASDFEKSRGILPEIEHGAFAENMIVEGLDLQVVGLGSTITMGESAVLQVTQIGKECHTPCRIGKLTGSCILPDRGIFARVTRGGPVAVGDEVRIPSLVPRERMQVVVITVSDRCHAKETEDTAGPAVASLLEERLGAHVYAIHVVPDEQEQIRERLEHFSDGHSIDLVVTAGGTGLSPRDVTPEATRDAVQRLVPGLDEAMRRASLEVTPHAALSRGVSGIRGRTLIINLPGSRKGAVENLQTIVEALPHAVDKLRGSPVDCAPTR